MQLQHTFRRHSTSAALSGQLSGSLIANSRTDPSSTVMVATTSRLAELARILKSSEAFMLCTARDCSVAVQSAQARLIMPASGHT